MGELTAQRTIEPPRNNRKQSEKLNAEVIGRRLMSIVVYGKRYRVGDKLNLDDLAATTEIGDWMMPDFKMACSYAASQGWFAVEGDVLTLTIAGSAAA